MGTTRRCTFKAISANEIVNQCYMMLENKIKIIRVGVFPVMKLLKDLYASKFRVLAAEYNLFM
jgi:hypothetical protein